MPSASAQIDYNPVSAETGSHECAPQASVRRRRGRAVKLAATFSVHRGGDSLCLHRLLLKHA